MAHHPESIAAARFVQPPVGLEIDGVARPERDQLHLPVESIDDAEPTDAVAPQALEFVAERLAGVRVLEHRLQSNPDLALEHRMETAQECRDVVWNPQAARR